MQGWAFYELIY